MLLKKAVAGWLPEDIIHRRKKGFGIPIAQWFRSGLELPSPSRVSDLHEVQVARRWNEYRAAKADHRLFLWSWLVLHHATSKLDVLTA